MLNLSTIIYDKYNKHSGVNVSMTELTQTQTTGSASRWLWRAALFLIIVIAGEWYVKWNPYYHKAFLAAAKHSLGSSIVSGKGDIAPAVSIAAAWHYAVAYYQAVWQAVILGVVVGAAVQVLLPRDWILKVLGNHNAKSVVAAGALSLPGMMCTCCSAPIVVGLRKQKVTAGSALAFWLGNPVLNPATIIFIGFVLGWGFALARIIFGLILVLCVGLLVNRFWPDLEVPGTAHIAVEKAVTPNERPVWQRFFIQVGRISLSVIPVYILLVLVMGGLRSWLFPAIDLGHAQGLLWIIGLAVAGTFFVIPTAGEVPIIQTMMHYGLGTAPALALLMTLPAISAPSLAMIWRHFRKRTLLFTVAATFIVGVAAGLTGMI